MGRIATPSEILDAMSGKKSDFSEYYTDTNQTIIRGVVLNEPLIIDNISCETRVSFVDCTFRAYTHIRGGTFSGLSVSGGTIRNPFMVYGGTFNVSVEFSEVDASSMEHDVHCSLGLVGGEFN